MAMLDIAWHPRAIPHPGPANAERLHSHADAGGRPARLTVAPGESLLDGLSAWLPDGASAIFSLLDGDFARCVYCLAAPDPSGRTVATYSPWLEVRNAGILGGSATLGVSDVGTTMVHCHSVFHADGGTGLMGGHLDPAGTIIGGQGLVVLARTAEELAIRQTPDPETNHSVFSPYQMGRS